MHTMNMTGCMALDFDFHLHIREQAPHTMKLLEKPIDSRYPLSIFITKAIKFPNVTHTILLRICIKNLNEK